MSLFRLFVPLLFIILAACSDTGNGGANTGQQETRPQLALTYSEAPIDLPGITAKYSADVRYGDGERNLFDIYLPESDGPTPLVIYMHGGAWIQGDKSDVSDIEFLGSIVAPHIRAFLQAGIAFASVNYSFIDIEEPYDDEGLIRPFMDSARALQFMRYHHKSLNLDPEQFASYGHSAGASNSLWLGTRDDLIDPDNADPILRESSRLKAVGALLTQASMNFLLWEDILAPIIEPFIPFLGGSDLLTAAEALGAGPLLLAATGSDTLEEVQSPEKIPYMQSIDALLQMDAGDAPIFASTDTSSADGSFELGDIFFVFLHHSSHVLALHERAQEVGLENVMYAGDAGFLLEDPSGEGLVSFLTRHIQ
jgi:para-nitrobenzyl esterase